MEEDDKENTAGPSAPAGAARAVQAGPLTASQKTAMGLVLRSIFLDGGAHSVKLAELVEQYNKKSRQPASAESIDQVRRHTLRPCHQVQRLFSTCIKLQKQACPAAVLNRLCTDAVKQQS